MRLGVSIDFRSAVEALDGAQKRQVPFAIAKTLTGLAFEARKHLVDVTGPRDFDIRNKRFLGVALRVDPARKDKLEATIYDRLGREYLKTQAEGGTKKPRGSAIAIPSRELQAKRTSTGVPKRLRPRNIPATFKLRIGADEYLARRKGRAKKLEVVYLLERKAMIPKRFRAYEDVAAVVQRSANEIFAREMARALASARP